MNPRQDHVYATVIAINNYRLEPRGKTVMTFYEVPAGQPAPVRAWFYPGDNYGQEFVYSKKEMTQLASDKTETVVPPAPVAEQQQTQEEQQQEVAQAPAPQPEPAPEVAQNETPAPPTPETPAPAPVMPQTGSEMPLFALAGLLSVSAAAGIGVFAKRNS
jgi:LPXTG-motif cell wall-anchored protein